MFPDSPIIDPALDKFNRLPFSQRIAEVIASRRDPSSIVIGIYGAWGEGKTTVFNFIEKILESNSDIICVRFNPWLFRDEEKLLLSFFKTLADALNRKLTTRKEEIGDLLKKFGGIIAPLSVADTTGIGTVRGTGQIVGNIGNLFSQVDLEENKKRLEKILDDESKRVVIFIDDIDRLEKSEIQSIFKLVKLSAGFRNTIYLLAFDEEKVAAAIAEKYGSGNLDAGRSFLEKIVQVPLTLPQISFNSLQKFCFECIDDALKNADIELTDDDIRRFVKYFSEGLAIQLKTPRVAQRYANTITFSIPLLKGEVNIVDLLLIEGVKVFYSKLYNSIKERPSYFLGEIIDGHTNLEEAKNLINSFIQESISSLDREAQLSAKNLLKELFPRLNGILGNISYGSHWQAKWTQEKRIASLRYFKRYFAYSIPEDDISDQELITFLSNLDERSISDIVNEIKEITKRENSRIETFITDIFRKIDLLSSSGSQKLALALAEMGDYFPRTKTFYYFGNSFHRAGILIGDLIQRIDTSDNKLDFCKEILQIADPIFFATECFRWMRVIKKDKEEDEERLFSEFDLKSLAGVVVDRIRNMALGEIIYVSLPDIARDLLSFWSYWSSREETNRYLQRTFEDAPYNSIEFLKCYIPTSWSMGMEPPYGIGLPFKGDIDRDQYDVIISVVDPELLIKFLRNIYGEKLDSPKFYRENDRQPLEELAACQFVYIHQKVLAELNDISSNSSEN
ncbi:MAG: KAP family NTPase [Cyanosarcina radialis HA8281-LM2]|jgi:predicted KAP-like P-loop ATPase|nr:KAP family NTPase [Cyanosarcina radialis HA8281-LM2]